MKIRLEPVTVASRAAVERLETAPGQEGFVESVAECLAEADRRRCWRPVGVYDGDALIGFAMYGFFWEYLPFGRLWLDRLLIDRRFQGRGYGRAGRNVHRVGLVCVPLPPARRSQAGAGLAVEPPPGPRPSDQPPLRALA